MNSLQKVTRLTMAARAMFIFVVLACVSCSVMGPPKTLTEDDKADLLKRVTERWHFVVKKDFASTYSYTTPKYREVFSKALYVNKFSYGVDLRLTGVEVLNYDAQAAVASVAVGVMSRPAKLTSVASNALGALPLTVNEKWIFVDGQWWHSAKD
jgi:hypothetical protein